jgi:hypothetical protein
MKTLYRTTVFIILIIVSHACRKEFPFHPENDPIEGKDSIVYKDVKGEVFNLCTDSGIGGITVYLEIYKAKERIEKYSEVSDIGGKFYFKSAPLHSSTAFSYNLYIPSKSGFSAEDRESCGIKGGSVSFNLELANENLRLNVIPSFIYLAFYFPRKNTTVASDSIIARCEQRIYHKNVPDYPYKFGDGAIGTEKGTYPKRIGNYPMGLYHIVVDKWIGGVHTQWQDSVYTSYGDSAKYVVNW